MIPLLDHEPPESGRRLGVRGQPCIDRFQRIAGREQPDHQPSRDLDAARAPDLPDPREVLVIEAGDEITAPAGAETPDLGIEVIVAERKVVPSGVLCLAAHGGIRSR